MLVKIIKCFVVFAFFTLAIQSLFANPTTASPRNQYETERTVSVPEETCPPVTNIQVEFLPPDKAFAIWDAVPGVGEYAVRVLDAVQTVILDTIVEDNYVTFDSLVPGESYTIEVCYDCEASNTSVCAKTNFDYIIIIEDLLVMKTGTPCDCLNEAGTNGNCQSSNSPHYSLIDSRVYNVNLPNSIQLAFFLESGIVKVVSNCAADFLGLGTESHGVLGQILPYYEVDGANIHFHGTTFCVSTPTPTEIIVTSCAIASQGKSGERNMDEITSSSVLFPNPFSDVLYVQTDELHDYTGTTSVLLYDAVGRLVLSQEVSNTMLNSGLVEINTSTLWAGFYWVSLLNNGVVLTTKRMIKVD